MPPTYVNQALKFRSGGGGVRVHMTKESKLLQKNLKKKVGCMGRGGGVRVDMKN